MSARAVRCRYRNRLNDPCPNPAAVSDPDAGITLCPRHLLEAHQLFAAMAKAVGRTLGALGSLDNTTGTRAH